MNYTLKKCERRQIITCNWKCFKMSFCSIQSIQLAVIKSQPYSLNIQGFNTILMKSAISEYI